MHKFLCFMLLSMIVTMRTPAVVNGAPVPDSDRRFDAVGLLLTTQPGANCGGWISGTATLIAPATVLIAKHSVLQANFTFPADHSRTNRVRFRRGVDGTCNSHYAGNPELDCAGPYQEIYIDRYIPCPAFGVDMVLCLLESSPVGVSPVPINPSHVFATSEPIILAGWGFDGLCVGQGEHWTLRSDQGVLPDQRFSSSCCIEYNRCVFSGECMVPTPGTDWVLGNLHDSGAPLFVEVPGQLPGDPPQLRLIAIVQNQVSAQKIGAWNAGGGQPPLTETNIRPGCIGDHDRNGEVTIEDLLDYVNAFLAGEPLADVDGVQGVTLSDLIEFVNHFLVGC